MNKKIIAIPALLAVVAGTAFVANNLLNQKDNGMFDYNLAEGMTLSVQNTTTDADWTSTNLTMSTKLTFDGATRDVIMSSVIGIDQIKLTVATKAGETDAAVNWSFTGDDCKDNGTAVECTKDINLVKTFDADHNMADFVAAAYDYGMASKTTTDSVLDYIVKFNPSKIVITDKKQGNYTNDQLAQNELSYRVSSGNIGLVTTK